MYYLFFSPVTSPDDLLLGCLGWDFLPRLDSREQSIEIAISALTKHEQHAESSKDGDDVAFTLIGICPANRFNC